MDKEPELSPVEMLFSAAESGNLNKLSCLLDQGVDVNSCSKYGTTLLQSAVLEDHGDLVQFLIGRGAQVDLPDISGITPLHLAAQMGRKNVTEILIANSANVTAKDFVGKSPLHWAVYCGRWDVVDVLRRNGGLPDNSRGMLLAAVLDDDVSAFLLALGLDDRESHIRRQAEPAVFWPDEAGAMLPHFASSRSSKFLNFLLAFFSCDALINTADNGGLTPLHIAIMSGSFNNAERLIGSRANVNARDNNGSTPLLISAHSGALGENLQIAEMLLTKGADVNARDSGGETPLHFASRASKEMTQLLVSWGADVNAADHNECTPLYWASSLQTDDIYDLLIDAGGDDSRPCIYGLVPLKCFQPITAYTESREKAWKDSIANGRINRIRALAEDGLPAVIDDNGGTPLHYAAGYGNLKIIDFLLACGVDINAQNTSGDTPLHYAMRQEAEYLDFDVVRILLKNSANLNAVNKSKRTPLDVAIESERADANFVELLILHGAKINPDWPDLFLRRTEIESLLIENGADVAAKFGPGDITALHRAASENRVDLMRLLISHGADLEARDKRGQTPLFAAVESARADAARLLLASGADVNATDSNGLTPLDMAFKSSSIDRIRVRSVLVARGALTAENL